jgi:hypothetical protein
LNSVSLSIKTKDRTPKQKKTRIETEKPELKKPNCISVNDMQKTRNLNRNWLNSPIQPNAAQHAVNPFEVPTCHTVPVPLIPKA